MKLHIPTIVYCASRMKNLREVEASVDSVRAIYPKIEIILFTCFKGYTNDSITQILQLKNPQSNFSDKIYTLIETDRKHILFLDGDTQLIKPIDELFELYNSFDLAVAHAPNRWTVKLDSVPDAFPEYNTGVILLKKSWTVKQLLKNWLKDYLLELKKGDDFPSKDQPSFRKVLYNSKRLRFTTLTPEYNCRFSMGAFVSHTVKLLHGRSKDFNYIKSDINSGAVNEWSNEPKIRWIKYE